MRSFPWRVSAIAEKFLLSAIVMLFSVSAAFAQAQASTADLVGSVVDQNDAAVPGATVTVNSSATGISRTVTTNDSGEYQVFALPPGEYEITATAPTFKKAVIAQVRLTVGQRAELKIPLEVGTEDVIVNVPLDSVALVETTRTTVSTTISQQSIENLPINERSATGFALTISSANVRPRPTPTAAGLSKWSGSTAGTHSPPLFSMSTRGCGTLWSVVNGPRPAMFDWPTSRKR